MLDERAGAPLDAVRARLAEVFTGFQVAADGRRIELGQSDLAGRQDRRISIRSSCCTATAVCT